MLPSLFSLDLSSIGEIFDWMNSFCRLIFFMVAISMAGVRRRLFKRLDNFMCKG